VQSFLKDQEGVSELLQLDNQTAGSHVNNLGGTVSPQLTIMAKDLWMWPLSRDIVLTAEHIPGITNFVADAESSTWSDKTDLNLHLEIFREIESAVGSTRGRFIYILSVQSAPTILQMASPTVFPIELDTIVVPSTLEPQELRACWLGKELCLQGTLEDSHIPSVDPSAD